MKFWLEGSAQTLNFFYSKRDKFWLRQFLNAKRLELKNGHWEAKFDAESLDGCEIGLLKYKVLKTGSLELSRLQKIFEHPDVWGALTTLLETQRYLQPRNWSHYRQIYWQSKIEKDMCYVTSALCVCSNVQSSIRE